MTKNELAPVVRDCIRFCKRNFGTTDLRECKEKLKEAYELAWRRY